MAARERFLATMHYEHRDHSPLGEMGYWDETLERWRDDGMESEPDQFFGHDFVREVVPVDQGPLPLFVTEILEETMESRVRRRFDGAVVRERRDGTCMPQWLRVPAQESARLGGAVPAPSRSHIGWGHGRRARHLLACGWV